MFAYVLFGLGVLWLVIYMVALLANYSLYPAKGAGPAPMALTLAISVISFFGAAVAHYIGL